MIVVIHLLLPANIAFMFKPVLLLLLLPALSACSPKNKSEDPEVWKKVKLDFKRFDADGLAGAADSKGSVHYEFCIPADEKAWEKVHDIDSTAQKIPGSKGRSGCTDKQWLVIGCTHQKNYQRVLYELAALPFVARIEETFWE